MIRPKQFTTEEMLSKIDALLLSGVGRASASDSANLGERFNQQLRDFAVVSDEEVAA